MSSTHSLEPTIEVSVGDDAVFEFQVLNPGPDPVDLQFKSSNHADVAVYSTVTDEVVWRWSDDRMFAQVIETETLAPSETLVRDFTWENPPRGDYLAVGTLEANIGAEAKVEFSIGSSL